MKWHDMFQNFPEKTRQQIIDSGWDYVTIFSSSNLRTARSRSGIVKELVMIYMGSDWYIGPRNWEVC